MHLTQFKAVIAASLLASGSIVVRSLESAIRQPLKGSTSSQYKRFDAQLLRFVYPSTFSFYLFLDSQWPSVISQMIFIYTQLHLHMWLPQIAMTQWSRTKQKSIFHLAQACLMGIFYQSQRIFFCEATIRHRTGRECKEYNVHTWSFSTHFMFPWPSLCVCYARWPFMSTCNEFTQKPPYKQANPERTSSSPPPCTQVLHLTIENKGLRLGRRHPEGHNKSW